MKMRMLSAQASMAPLSRRPPPSPFTGVGHDPGELVTSSLSFAASPAPDTTSRARPAAARCAWGAPPSPPSSQPPTQAWPWIPSHFAACCGCLSPCHIDPCTSWWWLVIGVRSARSEGRCQGAREEEEAMRGRPRRRGSRGNRIGGGGGSSEGRERNQRGGAGLEAEEEGESDGCTWV
jgi:hypothetical protein